jgi:methyl-accepting chemotaxis protein
MRPAEILKKNYFRNFLMMLLVVLLVGTAISAVVLFFNIHRPLNTHYSAVISIISQLRDSLIITTIKVNVIFIFLVALGLGILTLLYTHRVAGPLFRIRQKAKSIASGDLTTEIKLRRKDAVTAFAESINNMTKHYKTKVIEINEDIQQMKSSIHALHDTEDKPQERSALFHKINSLDGRIKEIFDSLKL